MRCLTGARPTRSRSSSANRRGDVGLGLQRLEVDTAPVAPLLKTAGPAMLMSFALCRGAVALARRPVERIGAHGVADGAALHLGAFQPEARLMGTDAE